MRKLLKNFSLNTLNQIVILLIPLITTPYLTRALGANSLGTSTYVLSIAILFYSIGTLGTNIYSRREIAYTVAKKENLRNTYLELFVVRLILTVLTICVYVLFSIGRQNEIIYYIFILSIIGNMMDVSWFFIGLEDMKCLVIRNCIVRIVSMLAIFIFVKKPGDVYLYAFIKGIGDFIAFVIMLPYVAKIIRKYKRESICLKKHIIPIIKFFLPQAASIIYVQCDKIMIGHLTANMSLVTIYEKGEALIKLPVTFVNALSAVALPRIANMYAGEGAARLNPIMRKITNYTLLFILPIVIGMGLVADIFAPIYLGQEYVDASKVMILLIPAVLAISLSSITGIQYLMPLNETRILTISYLFAAIANIILNYFFIELWGIIGAAFATDFAEIIVFIIQYRFICRKYEGFNIIDDLFKRIVALLSMIIIVILLKAFFGKAILAGLMQILAGAIIYFLIIILTKDRALLSIIERLRRKNDQI